MIMWFGVGPESKVAMGTLSCFFPIVLSAAAGMRQIEGVLIRVGRSFRLNTWQMVTKIYLPAMREPIVNGVRLGMGVAMIGTLLAETKLSNKGIGFMIIDAYNTFDMPRMYAVLLMLFVIAIGANALVGRASRRLDLTLANEMAAVRGTAAFAFQTSVRALPDPVCGPPAERRCRSCCRRCVASPRSYSRAAWR